jgi:hypothetical protein
MECHSRDTNGSGLRPARDKLRDTHHVLASPCKRACVTDYYRNFIAGGSFFFTLNLAERRLRLLTEHIDELRAEDWASDVSNNGGNFGEWPHVARRDGGFRRRTARPPVT